MLVDRDPDALVSQTPTWIDCMCAFGFQDASRLYESRSGARFVLPMVRRAAPLVPYLDIYASMPMAWGMGGLLCERPPSADEMRSIVADLRATAALRTSIRPNPLHAERWAAAMDAHVTAIPRRAHVLELTGGTARLWSELPKRTRQGVHKAERGGVEIECDTAGRFVGAYFDLYALSIERWAQQQHEPLWVARGR
ncbi:MAG: hypothetical protein ACXVSL_04345, partial [Solirubrobacteraceae bacterium]